MFMSSGSKTIFVFQGSDEFIFSFEAYLSTTVIYFIPCITFQEIIPCTFETTFIFFLGFVGTNLISNRFQETF